MRVFLIGLFLVLFVIDGSAKYIYSGDFDGDKKDESFRLYPFASDEYGVYYQLNLYDDDGSLLWSGPKTKDESNPFISVELDSGVSLPEGVVDIDGDKKAELIVPYPQGDVSPVLYKVLKYRHKKVELAFEKVLLMSPNNKDKFIWTKCGEYCTSGDGYGWLLGIDAVLNRSRVVGNIVFVSKSGNYSSAEAVLRFVKGRAVVEDWIENFALEPTGYLARIGKRDHYNSKGKLLGNIYDILRQDRANYYKERGDIEDRGIDEFDTPKKRTQIAKMKIVPVNLSIKELKSIITYGTPLLYITVDKKSNTLKIHLLSRF